MNIGQFFAYAIRYAADNPSQRRGQAFFNALYQVRPEIANAIRGTTLDPFYRDERIPAFAEHLVECWLFNS